MYFHGSPSTIFMVFPTFFNGSPNIFSVKTQTAALLSGFANRFFSLVTQGDSMKHIGWFTQYLFTAHPILLMTDTVFFFRGHPIPFHGTPNIWLVFIQNLSFSKESAIMKLATSFFLLLRSFCFLFFFLSFYNFLFCLIFVFVIFLFFCTIFYKNPFNFLWLEFFFL